MKNQINNLQLSTIFIFLVTTPFFGIGTYSIIKFTKNDAWLSVLIGGIFAFLIVLDILYISNYKPDFNIIEKIDDVFGKFFGLILKIILLFLTITMLFVLFYNLIHFIVSQFLFETPNIAIAIMFGLIILYINIKGIETLSRTSLVLFIFSLICLISSCFSLISTTNLENIKPILDISFNNFLSGTIKYFLLIYIYMYLILIIPKNKIIDKPKYNKYLIISYFISYFMNFLVIFTTLTNLGNHILSAYQYPEYSVLKRIKIFDFIDRIENVLIIMWVFGLFIIISFIVYFITKVLKKKKEKSQKKILYPLIITIIMIFVTFIVFPNNTVFDFYITKISPYLKFSFLIIMIILSIGIFIKRKIRT